MLMETHRSTNPELATLPVVPPLGDARSLQRQNDESHIQFGSLNDGQGDPLAAEFRRLASSWADTPSALLLQIMAINEQRETPLYSPEDIKLIMNAVALNNFHSSHSLHLTERSVTQHNIGSASCQLMTGAPAAEVAFAAIHTFWYGAEWTSKISEDEICGVRAFLAGVIGEGAESLLWNYSNLFIHGQDPNALQHHVNGILEQNRASPKDNILYRFIICDEMELVRLLDRSWFDDIKQMQKRLGVIQQIAPLVGFPENVLKQFSDGTRLMIRLLEDRKEEMQFHKNLWRDSTPTIQNWVIPPMMRSRLKAQLRNPMRFVKQWEKQIRNIEAQCPPENVTRYAFKDHMEEDLRRLFHWQSEIGAILRTEMLYKAQNDRHNATTLAELFVDRIKNVVHD